MRCCSSRSRCSGRPGEPPYAEHTLVDQAVAAARARAPRSAGFVNAVLRRFLREREALVAAALADPLARFNHPAWWLDRLRADWPRALAGDRRGRQPASADDAARQRPAQQRRGLRRVLAEAGIGARHGHRRRTRSARAAAVVARRPVPVTQLPGFADGESRCRTPRRSARRRCCSPSRRPAARACSTPAPRPAARPRTCSSSPTSTLLAIDRDPARLARVDETLARLGLAARDPAPADAGEPGAWWDGRPFDAILLDAPCSASGIVRRHPDVRWLRRAGDIDGARRDPGAPARRALAAARARRPAALRHLLGLQGRRAGRRSTLFCNDRATPPRPRSPPSPGHLLPLPDNDGRAVARLPQSARRLLPRPDRETSRPDRDRPPMTRAAAARLPAPPQRASRARRRGVAGGAAGGGARRPARRPGPALAAEPELTDLRGHPRRGRRVPQLRRRLRPRQAAEDALVKAVPLFFVAEAEIFRDRWYWRDRRVAHAVRVWQIALPAAHLDLPRDDCRRPEPELPDPRRGARRRSAAARAGRSPSRASSRTARTTTSSSTTGSTPTLLPRPMQIGIGGQPDWQLQVKRTQRIN